MLEVIINVLSVFEVVQKHTCSDSATLNQDTCRCECRDDEEICDRTDEVLDFVPRLPGGRQSDELSTCHDKCCGGQMWSGSAMGLCSCYCPRGTGNEPQELKPCSDTDCVDLPYAGMKCANEYPPDVDPKAWFPPPSKYKWDSTVCDWVCKDECPTGQKHGANCTCICKSAEEAGCSVPDEWRTTSDAITGEAVSCECVPTDQCSVGWTSNANAPCMWVWYPDSLPGHGRWVLGRVLCNENYNCYCQSKPNRPGTRDYELYYTGCEFMLTAPG